MGGDWSRASEERAHPPSSDVVEWGSPHRSKSLTVVHRPRSTPPPPRLAPCTDMQFPRPTTYAGLCGRRLPFHPQRPRHDTPDAAQQLHPSLTVWWPPQCPATRAGPSPVLPARQATASVATCREGASAAAPTPLAAALAAAASPPMQGVAMRQWTSRGSASRAGGGAKVGAGDAGGARCENTKRAPNH